MNQKNKTVVHNPDMSLYLIGDLQGCLTPFERLLDKVDFSPSRDTVYLMGDLVNRGPDSLNVLQHLMALGNSAQALLGNHDLHLLAVWHGLRRSGRKDTLQGILRDANGAELIDWLRHRPMALLRHGWLMVHAGVLPQWDASLTVSLAAEVEQALRGPDMKAFLGAMYGDAPAAWNHSLRGPDRLRVIVNALTRLRFCNAEGVMELSTKDGAECPPSGYLPWFDVPGRATVSQPIAFGHWSTLASGTAGKTELRKNILPLDTGCVWGGCLTAARLGPTVGSFELIQVRCEALQVPG